MSDPSPSTAAPGAPALHGALATYKRPGALGTMLAKLVEQERPPVSLVVVDNDPAESARPVVEAVASTWPPSAVTYLAAGGNLGPAGGLAVAMRTILERASDDDWVVSLDDDDPPPWPDVFARLLDLGERLRATEPRVGGVGMVGGRYSTRQALAVRVPDDELTGAVPVDWIAGNQFPIYSVPALRAVGVFDERLFFGFEELDLGLRLRAAGWSIHVDGDLWRRARTAAGRLDLDPQPARGLGEPGWRRYYSLRNMLYILRKQGARGGAVRLAARNLGKPVVNLPRDPGNAVRHLRLNARAIADAARDRMDRTVEPG